MIRIANEDTVRILEQSRREGVLMPPFRADRLATLCLVRPWRRAVGGRNRVRIPILMYHSVSEPSVKQVHPYFVTETSPDTFDAHMKYLHDNGYCAISPDRVVTLLGSEQFDAKKYVAVTFDDGYRDFYTTAYPILSKYGFTAAVYLPTAYIDERPIQFLGKECLTWPEIRELHEAGVVFGSHTVHHPKLISLSNSEMETEIRSSKETIENELGSSIDSFAYPYAFPEDNRDFVHRLRDFLEACGYRNGVSTIIGSVHSLEERFFLKRLPANSWDDPELFQAKLDGDYDWLRNPQYLKKLIKRDRSS